MSKSVYSLVLMDEVIEEIDKEAGRLGMSRSNLINRILAEAVSFTTPQHRIETAFRELSKIIGTMKYLSVSGGGGSVISVKSPISYKYNPTVRYSFSINDFSKNPFGEIKAAFRTQSREFIYYVTEFFKSWHRLENALTDGMFAGGIEAAITDGKYVRKLKLPSGINSAEANTVGRVAAEYIKLLDGSLKAYFENPDAFNNVFSKIKISYIDYMENNPFVI